MGTEGDSRTHLHYAGFWARILANALDTLLIFSLLVLGAVAIVAWCGVSTWSIAALYALMALPVAYFVVLESGPKGASLGKHILCLRVTRQNGQPTGYVYGLLRFAAFTILAPLTAGYLIQPFTPRRQALHDLVSSTLVIQTGDSVARNMLKSVLYALATVVAIPLALYTGLLAYNWNDEPLSPQVQSAMAWQVPDSVYVDNAYLILLGNKAAANESAIAQGAQTLRAWEHDFERRQKAGDVTESPPKTEPVTPPKDWLCKPPSDNCLTFYLANRETMARELAESDLQLSRYAAIRAMPNFVEVAFPRYDAPRPDWSWLAQASEKVRVQALYEVAKGDIEKGLDLFLSNAQFSRRLLAASASIDSRVTALGMVRKDASWVAEVSLAFPAVLQRRQTDFANVLQPVGTDVYSFRTITETVNRNGYFALTRLQITLDSQIKALAYKRFFQVNATQNLGAKISALRSERLAQPAHMLEATPLDDSEILDLYGWGVLNMFYPKNPIGKLMLTGVAFEPQLKWVELQHDIDGYLRLTRLQQQIIQKKVPSTEIREFLAATPDDLRNPYTLEPMAWSEADQTLEFTGRRGAQSLASSSKTYRVSLEFKP